MHINQKVPNSQWVAHNSESSDVIPKTMRASLLECKAAYIWQHVLPVGYKEAITKNWLWTGSMPPHQQIVDTYEEEIPLHIHFVIVTLGVRWETTVKGSE